MDINGALNNNAFDLAENYPSLDESLEAGDVVSLDVNYNLAADDSGSPIYNTVKSTMTGDDQVVGVVSTKPGLILGGGSFRKEVCDAVNSGQMLNVKSQLSTVSEALAHADYVRSCRAVKEVPVALAGRVPVKVSAANGEIKAGDFLRAASLPGYAEKATEAGMVIGKALESYPKSNQGVDQPNKIMVMVNVSWYDPAAAGSSNLESRISKQTQNSNSVFDIRASNLTVVGSTSLADLTVAGNILVSANLNITDDGVEAIVGDLNLQKLGRGKVNIFAGQAVFTSDGSLTLKGTLIADKVMTNTLAVGKVLVATESATPVSSSQLAMDSGQTASESAQSSSSAEPNSQLSIVNSQSKSDASIGSVVIKVGERGVVIRNNSMTANSIIFVTPERPVAIGSKKIGSDEFEITLDAALEEDLRVNWWIVN